MKIKIELIIFTVMIILLRDSLLNKAIAKETIITSKDQSIKIFYNIEDNYKVSLRIDTAKKKNAYIDKFKADVFSIDVDFKDINNDGLTDIIIKFSDEAGYSPRILRNQENMTFQRISFEQSIYINTELQVTDKGKFERPPDYKLIKLGKDGAPGIIFFNVMIGEKTYKSITYKLIKENKYIIYRRE